MHKYNLEMFLLCLPQSPKLVYVNVLHGDIAAQQRSEQTNELRMHLQDK